MSFNPLRSGALVSSQHGRLRHLHPREVSIPFVAGHWFPRQALQHPEKRHARVSIPFVAGHWFPRGTVPLNASPATSFNPLRSGALVSSRTDAPPPRRTPTFQSPS